MEKPIIKKSIIKKEVFTELLVSMGYALSTFVSFPRMAPFQHFTNVIAAVFLGPFWGFTCALMIGLMRMILNGSTILAVIEAIVGAFLSGLLYKIFHKLIWAVIGEVIWNRDLKCNYCLSIYENILWFTSYFHIYLCSVFYSSFFNGSNIGLYIIEDIR